VDLGIAPPPPLTCAAPPERLHPGYALLLLLPPRCGLCCPEIGSLVLFLSHAVIITRLSLFFVRVLHLDAPKIHLFVCSVILPLLGIGLAEWLVLTGGSGWWDKEQPAGVDHVIYIPSLFSPVVEWRLGGEICFQNLLL